MRSRGQAGRVEKRGSTWYGHFFVYVRQPDGTEKRHHKGISLGKRSEMDKVTAKDKLRAHILATKGTADCKQDDAVTLQWFTENRYLPMKTGGWRPATERGNRGDLRRYVMPALGAVLLKDLDTFKCQQFVYALANPAQRKKIKTGLSEPVIKRCRTMLKAICEMAVDMEFLHKNPARKLTIPDCKVTSKPTLPGDTLRTLLDAITDPRDHLVMLIGVFCAVRPSELFGLKWSAHDGDKLFIRSTAWKGKLYEGKTKTRKSRAPIYLSSLIACEIDRWKKLCPDSSPDALMFPTANGTPLEARNFLRDCVKPIVARINAQLEKRNRPAIAGPITFQVLRRSAATRNQKHGTMKDVQQLMRHSSIETTAEVYMQPIPESVKQMVEMDLAEVMGQQQLLELHSDQLDMTWPEKAETERIQ